MDLSSSWYVFQPKQLTNKGNKMAVVLHVQTVSNLTLTTTLALTLALALALTRIGLGPQKLTLTL